MSDKDQVIAQMVEAGMPALPANHPLLDGRIHRFGPEKKGWYALREMTLNSGRIVVVGAFGYFQGEDRNTVRVKVDTDEMSGEDRAAYIRQMRAQEERESAERDEAARLAANRAKDQWAKAAEFPLEHAYLVRKRITPENVRVSEKGLLLVPMTRDGQLVGVQKIPAGEGKKLTSKDMNAVGARCILGDLSDAPIIMVGEGYATCRSARMALVELNIPVVVAFNAGGLLTVAQRLRQQYPAAHLIFLADDDYLLAERLAERLREDFKVDVAVPIDGVAHTLIATDGEKVSVVVAWKEDAQGIAYIETDIRKGRRVYTSAFRNAGVASCHAAAKRIGNASVATPLFQDRAGRKLTDWNDLHVEESLDAVTAQLSGFILAAQQPSTPLAVDVDGSAPDGDGPPDDWYPAEGESPGLSEYPSSSMDSPHPSEGPAAPVMTGIFSLEWALSHCALVQGSTDIWDGLNKLRMKRAAFVDMVGKDGAKAWNAHANRRTISPRNLPRTIRGVASETGGAGGDNIVMMLDRYTLLYGTKTVFDADKRTIVAYDAMALARGADLATRWLAHPLHMEKDYDKVVFDPTQRVDLNTHINLFEGFPLTPRQDDAKAELVLDLLWSLCQSEANGEDVFRWVLCWLAYPLQHPGAKMQTALLFFGEKQGTGKSLFFEGIVRPIYGNHGATGGQHQLEGAYTMWRSQKLFVLFEEILSRADKYSYFGLIKHMITGRDTPISQKFKDDRVEANHMNCVMLSNEFQAVPLEPEDRRILVVDVRQPLDGALLARITAVLGDGLIEAFYAFLLAYPLGDFNEHSKPIMTPAKERVINFGRPDWESFYLAWSADELSAPYCSCLSTDLYNVFSRYCSKYGLRSMSMTKFSELIGQRLKKDRQWVSIDASARKLLSVFHVPYVPADGATPARGREGSISEQCGVFRKLADIRTEL